MDIQDKTSPFRDFPRRLSLLIAEELQGNQRELSKRSGVSPQAISNYVNAPSDTPRIPKSIELYAISKALGVSMEYLLTGEDTGGGAPRPPDIDSIRLEERQRMAARLKKLLAELEP